VSSGGSSGRLAGVDDATVVVSPGVQTAAAAPTATATTRIYHGYFTPRFCERCRMYRPQGSHHCSDCNRCVLAMDHHCPWVCNCVGARNHKYFVLFLFYIFASGCHIAATVAAGYMWFGATSRATLLQHTINVMVGICGGVFAISMGLFFAFHIFLIANDTTTVDRNIAALKGLRSSSNGTGLSKGGGSGAAATGAGGVVLSSDGGNAQLSSSAILSATNRDGSSGSGLVVADGRIAGVDDDDGVGQRDETLGATAAADHHLHDDDEGVAVPINSDDESEAVHKAARAGFSLTALLSGNGGGSPNGLATHVGSPIRRLLAAVCAPIVAAIRLCGRGLTSCMCRGMTPQQLRVALSATLGAPNNTIGVLIWFIPVAPTWPHAHPGRRAAGEWTMDPPEKVSPYVPTTVNYEGYVLVPPTPSLLIQGPTFPPTQPTPQEPQGPLLE
jgi:hypothetical protein